MTGPVVRLTAVVAMVPGVAEPELRDWIARGWLRPGGEPPEWAFAVADVERARIIRALRHEADVAADHLALVLRLLDRTMALRTRLQRLDAALAEQPSAVRAAVEAALDR